jgi:hypothetical protein
MALPWKSEASVKLIGKWSQGPTPKKVMMRRKPWDTLSVWGLK